MIALHRLVGNLVGRGHGEPLLSAGFPAYQHAPLTRFTKYRLPSVGAVSPAAAETLDNGFLSLFKVFEIHALSFGQFAVFSSTIFKPSENLRPFNYTDMVMFADDDGRVLPAVPLETAVAFDGFITPTDFVQIAPQSTHYPATQWTPATYAPAAGAAVIPEPMRRALLARYWASASSRAFHGTARTFTVCLSDEERPRLVIDGARAFLMQSVLGALPPAVSQIASLSACVPQNGISGVFSDAAMVVVCPNTVDPKSKALIPSKPNFDLRTGAFEALNPIEDAFMASLLNHERLALLDDIYARYGRLTGCASERDCSILADYDIALMLYMIEHRLTDASMLVKAWRQLYLDLANHHLTDEQVGALLAGVEEMILKDFRADPAKRALALQSCDQEAFAFLWRRAMRVAPEMLPMLCETVTACPDAFAMTIAQLSAEKPAGEDDARAATLLSAVFADHDAPLNAAQVAAMMAQPFADTLAACPATRAALTDCVSRSNGKYPDNLLVTLPVTVALGGSSNALNEALERLLLHAPALPELPLCENLSASYAACADDRSRELLCQYVEACVPACGNDLSALVNMICAIGADASEVMVAIFRTAADHHILYDARQSLTLFERLLPLCGRPADVCAAYMTYESAVTEAVHEPTDARLARLAALHDALRAIGMDATGAATAMLSAFADAGQLLTREQSDQFAGRLLDLCRDQAGVGEAFRRYLSAVTRKRADEILVHPETVLGMTGMIRATGTDMTETLCGLLNTAAQAKQILTPEQLALLMEQLLPLCRDGANVSGSFFAYVDFAAQAMLEGGTDSFNWFEQIAGRVPPPAGGAHAAQFRNELALHAFSWRCKLGVKSGAIPDEHTFSALLSFSRDRGSGFARVENEVAGMYDALFTRHGNQQALLEQFEQLFSGSVSTKGHSATERAYQEIYAKRLIEGWRGEPYFTVIAGVRRELDSVSMSEEALLTPEVEKAAEHKLAADFSRFSSAGDYQREWAANQAQRHTPFGSRWQSALSRSYQDQFESLFLACEDVAAARLLVDVAAQLDCWKALQKKPAAVACQKLLNVYDIITQKIAPAQALNARANFGNALKQLDETGAYGDHAVKALRASCGQLPWAQIVQPASVYIALLCAYAPQQKDVDWQRLISQFSDLPGDKLPAPSSTGGGAVLATVVGILGTLSGLNKVWADRMTSWLRMQEPFASFTAKLSQNKKLLDAYFPKQSGSAGRQAVAAWLGLSD